MFSKTQKLDYETPNLWMTASILHGFAASHNQINYDSHDTSWLFSFGLHNLATCHPSDKKKGKKEINYRESHLNKFFFTYRKESIKSMTLSKNTHLPPGSIPKGVRSQPKVTQSPGISQQRNHLASESTATNLQVYFWTKPWTRCGVFLKNKPVCRMDINIMLRLVELILLVIWMEPSPIPEATWQILFCTSPLLRRIQTKTVLSQQYSVVLRIVRSQHHQLD